MVVNKLSSINVTPSGKVISNWNPVIASVLSIDTGTLTVPPSSTVTLPKLKILEWYSVPVPNKSTVKIGVLGSLE